jgi:IS605 OrfB family transposase
MQRKNEILEVLEKLIEESLEKEEITKYWTFQSKNISNKLWLPSVTNCKKSQNSFPKSWCSVNTFSPKIKNIILPNSIQYSQPALVLETKPLTTMKIRIFPNENQNKIMEKYYGMSRYVYNNSLVTLKVLTTKNPLNSFYDRNALNEKQKCTFKKGKNKNCGKECEGDFCELHTPEKKNACTYIPKKGKNKDKVCGKPCSNKFCSTHLNSIRNAKNKFFGKISKISNISVRKFVEKVNINDNIEWYADTKEERKILLEKFIKTMDNPEGQKYEYDETKEEKMWRPEWLGNDKFPSRMYRGAIDILTQDINSCLSNGNLELNIRLKTKKDSHFIINSDQWSRKENPFPCSIGNLNGYYKVGRQHIRLKRILEKLNDYEKVINNERKRTYGYELKISEEILKFEGRYDEKRSYQILKDEFGKTWLNLPVSPEFFFWFKNSVKNILQDEIQVRKNKFPVASLDPGVRTFQTVYGLNHIVEIGRGDCWKVFKLLKLEDKYVSKKRKNMKKLRKTRKKVKNLVDDLHRKTVSFLTSTYESILLPSFDVSKMVKGKRLNKKTKRQMLAFRYYMFKQRLIDKCVKKGVEIRIVSEAYTTGTCAECGTFVKMGGKEIYTCKNDECELFGVRIGRDHNAPRNILIRNVKEISLNL